MGSGAWVREFHLSFANAKPPFLYQEQSKKISAVRVVRSFPRRFDSTLSVTRLIQVVRMINVDQYAGIVGGLDR